MHSLFSRFRIRVGQHRSTAFSAVVHAVLLLCITGGLFRAPRIAPYRLPGTDKGSSLLLTFQPGSLQAVAATTPRKSKEKPKPPSKVHDPQAAPQVAQTPAARADAGVGAASESGLGQGDISIALETYFPHPKPDLSSLPHGTRGDVILNAVIDEQGNIAELTLVQGLGPQIDDTVMATVRQWRYTPAKKNGVPVISEQELHFHYERG